MATKLLAFDDVTNQCELVDLTPYPIGAVGDLSLGVTATTDAATGQVTYTFTAFPDKAAAVAAGLLVEVTDLGGNVTGYLIAP